MNLKEFLLAKKETLKQEGKVVLSLKVKTHAKNSLLLDLLLDNETIKVALRSAPVEGKANQELISLLAGEFGVARNQVSFLKGRQSSFKLVKIVN